MKTLTKQQAIEEHRKMWNWIAKHGWEVYYNGAGAFLDIVTHIKNVYILRNKEILPIPSPYLNCFCCEYVYETTDFSMYCRNNCPIDWGDGNTCISYEDSPFWKLLEKTNHFNITEQEFKSLALEIANLPEREGI